MFAGNADADGDNTLRAAMTRRGVKWKKEETSYSPFLDYTCVKSAKRTEAVCPNEAQSPCDLNACMHYFCLQFCLQFTKTMLKVMWQRTGSRDGITGSLLKWTLEESLRRSWERLTDLEKSKLGWTWKWGTEPPMPGNFSGAVDLLLPPADFGQR